MSEVKIVKFDKENKCVSLLNISNSQLMLVALKSFDLRWVIDCNDDGIMIAGDNLF